MSLQKTYNILNEDFFDDSELTDDINIPDEEPLSNQDNVPNYEYTYHIQIIIHVWPLVKYTKKSDIYYFEIPKYKHLIESTFIAIKNALEYILKASSIVTDYSTPKFCATNSKFITEFPYMNNKPSSEFFKEFFHNAISLETTVNLSNRKTEDKIKKFLYSLWRIQSVYNKLMRKLENRTNKITPRFDIGVFRNKPYKKSDLTELIQTDDEWPDKLINVLNYKDETD